MTYEYFPDSGGDHVWQPWPCPWFVSPCVHVPSPQLQLFCLSWTSLQQLRNGISAYLCNHRTGTDRLSSVCQMGHGCGIWRAVCSKQRLACWEWVWRLWGKLGFCSQLSCWGEERCQKMNLQLNTNHTICTNKPFNKGAMSTMRWSPDLGSMQPRRFGASPAVSALWR
jgi:hypothetical protein